MAPKLSNEMTTAMQQQPGAPLEVVDDAGAVYVLLSKAAFVHLRDVCRETDDATRAELCRLIQEGIDCGPGIPADQMFAELREMAAQQNPSA